jgi:hypothetical protein
MYVCVCVCMSAGTQECMYVYVCICICTYDQYAYMYDELIIHKNTWIPEVDTIHSGYLHAYLPASSMLCVPSAWEDASKFSCLYVYLCIFCVFARIHVWTLRLERLQSKVMPKFAHPLCLSMCVSVYMCACLCMYACFQVHKHRRTSVHTYTRICICT